MFAAIVTIELMLAGQPSRVPDAVVERVRAALDESDRGYRYVETVRLGEVEALIRYTQVDPPERNRKLQKAHRANLEEVVVQLIDCSTQEGARSYIDAQLARMWTPDAEVSGLGDRAWISHVGDEKSVTTILLRVARYVVSVKAPTDSSARLFARSTVSVLLPDGK